MKINYPKSNKTAIWKKFLQKHSRDSIIDSSENVPAEFAYSMSLYQMWEGPLILLQEFDDGECNIFKAFERNTG